ncbi:hypothetical protein Tco_0275886 [Tanacetum coccineum]
MLPIVKNTNVIAPGMYKVHTKPNQTRTPQLHQDIRKPNNKRIFLLQSNIPILSLSVPKLKEQSSGDRVSCLNNSQGMKQECVLNDNHDLCVLHYINGVNSRTRQPMAVPLTVKKSRNITRKLYEQVSKACSWWYPKYTPHGYNWKPKSQKGNVNPNVSMPLGNASRTANILEHKTHRCSTVSNTPSSSNSFAARRDSSIHRRLWVLKAHDRKSQTS